MMNMWWQLIVPLVLLFHLSYPTNWRFVPLVYPFSQHISCKGYDTNLTIKFTYHQFDVMVRSVDTSAAQHFPMKKKNESFITAQANYSQTIVSPTSRYHRQMGKVMSKLLHQKLISSSATFNIFSAADLKVLTVRDSLFLPLVTKVKPCVSIATPVR